MPMKRMKARQDFIALNVTANESLENSGAFGAWKLAFNAVMGVSVAQGLTPALHLLSADFRFGFSASVQRQDRSCAAFV